MESLKLFGSGMQPLLGWGIGAVCPVIRSPGTEMWPFVGSLWEGIGVCMTLPLRAACVLGRMWARDGVGGQEVDVVGTDLL